MKLSFKIIKKIWVSLFVFAAFLIPVVTQAQSPNPPPTYKYQSFLNGYNVNVTNTAGAIGPFSTNVLFTTYSGRAVYSYTNTGTATNSGDAFNSYVRIQPDNNGVIQSNATLWLVFNETNWIPLTNSSGNITNWPLQNPIMGNNGALPGTANTYPTYAAQDTNFVTVTLSRAAIIQPQGDNLDGAVVNTQFETTPGYSQNITMIAPTGGAGVITNFVLPLSFLNGAYYVRIGITSTNSAGTSHGVGTLLSAAGILQPQQ